MNKEELQEQFWNEAGELKLDDWQKEICQEIRNIVPHYEDKDDAYIYNYCVAVTPIEVLCCNKGYTIKDAVKEIFK